MSELYIQTLGKSEVLLAGSPVHWSSGTARELFFYLLTYPTGQSRNQIAEILWDVPCNIQTSNRFRVTIYRIRHAIQWPNAILEECGRYSLASELLELSDIHRFSQGLQKAHLAVKPTQTVQHYQATLQLYKGDYLSDFESDWVLEARSMLKQRFALAQLELSRLLKQQGQHEASTQALFTALHSDPYLGEQHHQDLICRLAQTEGKYAAIEYYRRFVHFLHCEVDDHPMPETIRLVEQIKQDSLDFSVLQP